MSLGKYLFLALDQWSLFEPVEGAFPVGRHGHSAAVYQRFMCVYGGLADLETKDDLWLWDFGRNCRALLDGIQVTKKGSMLIERLG